MAKREVKPEEATSQSVTRDGLRTFPRSRPHVTQIVGANMASARPRQQPSSRNIGQTRSLSIFPSSYGRHISFLIS